LPRFSANLGFLWTELPLPDRSDAAARAGFRAVAMHCPYDHDPAALRDSCAANGVALLGINNDVDPAKGEAGLAALPGRGAEARVLIDKAFDWAATAGGTGVHVMAGKTPHDPASRRALIAALTHAAERAERTGLVAMLEPLNPHDMPGYFYSRTDQALEIIEAVGSPRVRLMFDCYHVGRVEGDVIGQMRALWPRIGHIQVAAVPSRAEPDEGDLDYRAVFAEIDRLGWPGWVGAEYRPRSGTEAGLGWVAALGQSLG
jgi:hydroxypyruvate isomerase